MVDDFGEAVDGFLELLFVHEDGAHQHLDLLLLPQLHHLLVHL